jgi:hypothetical protein
MADFRPALTAAFGKAERTPFEWGDLRRNSTASLLLLCGQMGIAVAPRTSKRDLIARLCLHFARNPIVRMTSFPCCSRARAGAKPEIDFRKITEFMPAEPLRAPCAAPQFSRGRLRDCDGRSPFMQSLPAAQAGARPKAAAAPPRYARQRPGLVVEVKPAPVRPRIISIDEIAVPPPEAPREARPPEAPAPLPAVQRPRPRDESSKLRIERPLALRRQPSDDSLGEAEEPEPPAAPAAPEAPPQAKPAVQRAPVEAAAAPAESRPVASAASWVAAAWLLLEPLWLQAAVGARAVCDRLGAAVAKQPRRQIRRCDRMAVMAFAALHVAVVIGVWLDNGCSLARHTTL